MNKEYKKESNNNLLVYLAQVAQVILKIIPAIKTPNQLLDTDHFALRKLAAKVPIVKII